MKKTPLLMGIACLAILASCKKDSAPETNSTVISQEETAMVAAAGFNSSWFEKTADGNYLIEGDILLSKEQLQELAGSKPTNNFIVGNEEHYRTTYLVNTNGGARVIKVSLGSGFPSYYSTGLDQALERYNELYRAGTSTIQFQRVASGGDIQITGANLGRSFGGGCILGQSAGFPTSDGNPAPGFKLSTTKCATSYISTADKADEVMAHEIGHAVGFRHTDYMNRISCGSNSNEGDSGVGAIHITGTITEVTSGNYNSWMMACTNGSPLFSAEDKLAINTVY
jgi:hypothetical protein